MLNDLNSSIEDQSVSKMNRKNCSSSQKKKSDKTSTKNLDESPDIPMLDQFQEIEEPESTINSNIYTCQRMQSLISN